MITEGKISKIIEIVDSKKDKYNKKINYKYYLVDLEYFPENICDCVSKSYKNIIYIQATSNKNALYKLFTIIQNHCENCNKNLSLYLNEMEEEMIKEYKVEIFTIEHIMKYFARPFITETEISIII